MKEIYFLFEDYMLLHTEKQNKLFSLYSKNNMSKSLIQKRTRLNYCIENKVLF